MPDPITGLVVGGGALLGSVASSKGASKAADAQVAAADRGVAAQERQFEAMREMLAPYAEGGEESLAAQQALAGLGGADAQQQAIDALQASPIFQAQVDQGENAILQNASATGGLRGGNVQAALAQFRPQMLSQEIAQQYNRLGGLTSLGQSSAAMTGNAGLQTATNQAALFNQAGAARAGNDLAQANIVSGLVGNFAGLGASALGGGKF